MIPLITPQSKGPEFAASLLAATSQETLWAQNLQEASTHLREQTYSAAIIDQFLLETEPEESDQVLEHLGTAFPVYVNWTKREHSFRARSNIFPLLCRFPQFLYLSRAHSFLWTWVPQEYEPPSVRRV